MLAVTAVPAAQAQSRGGGGNPVATLPQVNVPQSAPTVTVQVEQQSPQLAQLLARQITPRVIQIEGVKSIDFAQVSKLFAPLANQPTTIGKLIETANVVTKMYQDAGFALSFAFIPAQTFENDVVRIVAVEGYVSGVTITGDAGNEEGKIRSIADNIVRDRPLRRATFERYINILGLLPGTKIAANVTPPQNTDGATQMSLAVTRQRFSGGAGLNGNQPGLQGLLNATENGVLGLGEQLSVSALFPKGRFNQTYYALGYSQPLNSNGLTGRIDVSHYDGQPNQNNLPGVTRTVKQDKEGASVSYPFLLSNTRSVLGTVSAYAAYNEDRYAGNNAEFGLRSQTRVLQAQADYVDIQPTQVRKASVNVGKGLNILGASKDGFTVNLPGQTIINPADLNFVRTGVSFSQTNQWPFHLGTAVSFAGQFSPNSLPTSEEITFGGQRFGLGYEPGETAGDSGWGASFEINRPFALDLHYLKTLTPYISYDMARVYLHAGPVLPSRLASVAVGLRLSDARFYSLDLSVGRPVGDAPSESPSRSPRVNAAFSYQLN